MNEHLIAFRFDWKNFQRHKKIVQKFFSSPILTPEFFTIFFLNLSVNFTPMAYSYNNDQQLIIMNFINNTVFPHSDSPCGASR